MSFMSHCPSFADGRIFKAAASQTFSALASSEKPENTPPVTSWKESSFGCARAPAARQRQRMAARMGL